MFQEFVGLNGTTYKLMDPKMHFWKFVDRNNTLLQVHGSLVHFSFVTFFPFLCSANFLSCQFLLFGFCPIPFLFSMEAFLYISCPGFLCMAGFCLPLFLCMVDYFKSRFFLQVLVRLSSEQSFIT